MEKFKAIEKEMKTKAYSKEGLSQSIKLDPREKKRAEVSNWLSDSIDKLSTQQDVYEAEAEQLNSALGKKKKDSSKLGRIKTLNERVERHKFHVMCLERIQRLFENESLSTEQVDEIQDDVNYYVDENDDDEFVEDEFIYDHLNLDNEDLFNNPLDDDYSSDNDSDKEDNDSVEVENSTPTQTEPQGISVTTDLGIKISLVPPASQLEQKNAWKDNKDNNVSTLKQNDSSTAPGAISVAPIKLTSSIVSAPVPTHALAQPWAAVAGQGLTTNNPAAPNIQFRAQSSGSNTTNQLPEVAKKPTQKPQTDKKADSSSQTKPTLAQKIKANDFSESKNSTNKPEKSTNQYNNIYKESQPKTSESITNEPKHNTEIEDEFWPPKGSNLDLFGDSAIPGSLQKLNNFFLKTKENYSPLSKDSVYRKNMMEISLQTTPTIADQEKQKQYVPKNPTTTPSYYPQTPLPLFNQPGNYTHLGIDTLFFIFYYNGNTYHQYLASKELKRQSWRFHKKYLTWFQRYEEPLEITNDYENGSYLYFDYETSWCQRKKNNFSFEYQYLE
ncbi:General negative regulator of transcription subunit 3 [Smittium culicis]|uniref:General negative regulator of transcription subunit 3 n=1 Tax=Smittium culicis TaxID=133412 RepID=A0A1R1YSI0_9FUNG|nr:General negative regulator of transcription subunit 3 [Smittium culicis]